MRGPHEAEGEGQARHQGCRPALQTRVQRPISQCAPPPALEEVGALGLGQARGTWDTFWLLADGSVPLVRASLGPSSASEGGDLRRQEMARR